MKFSDAMPSKYLKGTDVKNGLKLTIRTYQMEEVGMGQDKKSKPVLYFREEKKGLVLTKATGLAITDMYGEEMDSWVGQKIVLFTAPKEIFGEIKPVIHVRAPQTYHGDPGQEVPF